VLQILRKVIDIPRASLLVIDTEKDRTVFSADDDGATGWAVPRAVPDELGVPAASVDEDALFSCTNLLKHNDLMVVFCAPTESLDSLSADDKVVLQAVASELAVAVENSQLYKLTKKLSVTDELTGLANYRFLQQRLFQEFERASRYDRALSLLMIDLDNFKDYNDEHGHLAGDRALAEFAGVLTSCVREVDVVARYGGEEFSVVLPETDAAGAFVTAEKIRETVAEHRFADADGEPSQHLTVSIGAATFPEHAADRETLLKQADNALYEAKHFGRDRVRSPHDTVDGRSQSAI
jgi:diguanylate cyclase (GGDEF)-like protein